MSEGRGEREGLLLISVLIESEFSIQGTRKLWGNWTEHTRWLPAVSWALVLSFIDDSGNLCSLWWFRVWFRRADVHLRLCWGVALLLTYHSSHGGSMTMSLGVICKSQPFLSVLDAVRQKVRAHVCSYCCSVAKLRVTLYDPMDRSTPGFPVLHQLPEFTQTHVHRVGDAIQLSHPLSSPSPPAFNLSQHQGLSQWVSSSIRWPKDWSFSFSISPSDEYSGLISLRMDWLDLLAVQGTLKSLLQPPSSKASVLRCSAFLMVRLSNASGLLGKL